MMGDVHHARVERMLFRRRRDAQLPRHAGDPHRARELAALAVERVVLDGLPADMLDGKLVANGARALVREGLAHKLEERLRVAVAEGVFVRVQQLVPVDAYRREGVDVLLVAQLLRVGRRAVDTTHAHLLRVRLLLELLICLPPHGLESLRPRAPRRAKSHQSEVVPRHEGVKVVFGEHWYALRHRGEGLDLLVLELLVLESPRRLHVKFLQVARVGRDAELDDLGRHVGQRRPHHVVQVHRRELARQPLLQGASTRGEGRLVSSVGSLQRQCWPAERANVCAVSDRRRLLLPCGEVLLQQQLLLLKVAAAAAAAAAAASAAAAAAVAAAPDALLFA